MTLEQLIKEHDEWAASTFPKCTAEGALIHAKKEIEETIQELKSGDPNGQLRLVTEYADIVFCVFDSARISGISVADIIEAGAYKLEINKKRTWKDNGDGSYSHVK